MKTLLRVTAAGLLLALPAIAGASTLDYSGTDHTLSFDPHASGPSTLPPPVFYRAYDCVVGKHGQLVVTPNIVTITPPAVNLGGTTTTVIIPPPADTGTTDTGGTTNTPDVNIITPSDGIGGNSPAAVPLPPPSEMAGVGLGAMTIFNWLRAKRNLRRR